jgi:hypothetical protein
MVAAESRNAKSTMKTRCQEAVSNGLRGGSDDALVPRLVMPTETVVFNIDSPYLMGYTKS